MEEIVIKLSRAQYEQLENELISLGGYHWNDDRIHASKCGSEVLSDIQEQVAAQLGK